MKSKEKRMYSQYSYDAPDSVSFHKENNENKKIV